VIQPLFHELKETLPETYRLRGLLEKEANQNVLNTSASLAEIVEEPLVLQEMRANGWVALRPNGEKINLVIEADTGQVLTADWILSGLFGKGEDGNWRLYGTPELYPPVVAQILGAPTSVLV